MSTAPLLAERTCRRPGVTTTTTDRGLEGIHANGDGDGFAFPCGQPADGLPTGKPRRLPPPSSVMKRKQSDNLTPTGQNSCRRPAKIVDVDQPAASPPRPPLRGEPRRADRGLALLSLEARHFIAQRLVFFTKPMKLLSLGGNDLQQRAQPGWALLGGRKVGKWWDPGHGELLPTLIPLFRLSRNRSAKCHHFLRSYRLPGYPRDIRQIMGLNLLRVMRANEALAEK